MEIPFEHHQSAHCETGVLSNLLSHHGLKISEAMVFGIGSGLFFGYFPFIRLNNLPLSAFRIGTGGIMKRVTKRLGVKLKWEKFRNPDKAMAALDRKLEQQIPVGCRTGAYWLSYFPRRYRFHFNMHNLVAYGKEGNDYIISDPVFPDPVRCPSEDLQKARFARGPMPPKGRMYFVEHIPENPDFNQAVKQGIKEVCKTMLKAPGPFLGIRGMRYLAKKMETWPETLGQRKAALYLGQVVRMQEEIGTGGAGFRYIYGAFLQEAADIIENNKLMDMSSRITEIGDQWREFAVMGSRICKQRASETETYPAMADILRNCAENEQAMLKELSELV
ncbi:BtrH N-terminal domain-containing protein [Desulfobacterales bacterium HSG17]|nr:BtrH N-terminal domain-containing protein [Desulfobacterales bacterium HSG17]